MGGRPVRASVLAGAVLAGCAELTGATDLRVGDETPAIDGDGSSGSSGSSEKSPASDAGNESVPEDSGAAPGEAGLPDAGSTTKRVFVSSATYAGNLGGLAGADAKCKELAKAAGLGGTFVAWLSTNAAFAIDRMTGEGPWSLVGQNETAVTKKELTNPPLSAPILRDEGGTPVNGLVWTGTNDRGRYFYGDCEQWMSSAATSRAAVGDNASKASPWTEARPSECNELRRLYCFEL